MLRCVIRWSRPSDAELARFVASERDRPLSYDARALAEEHAPPGWDLDHHRARLGIGGATFERACTALRSWAQFDLGWVDVFPRTTPIAAGACVAVSVRFAGLLFVNSARIVRVVDDQRPFRRFGFAYGTLPAHVERGEERFTVEFDPGSGEVWYDLRARSRPGRLWMRLGRPWVRRLQARFAADSMAAMQRATSG